MELKFILNGIGTSPMKELTINTDDIIGKEKHQNYQQSPTNDLHNPSTVVPPNRNVFLSLNSNHRDIKYSEMDFLPYCKTQQQTIFMLQFHYHYFDYRNGEFQYFIVDDHFYNKIISPSGIMQKMCGTLYLQYTSLI